MLFWITNFVRPALPRPPALTQKARAQTFVRGPFRLSKNDSSASVSCIIKGNGSGWRKDSRKEPVITDLDALVPSDHILQKIEKVMDYEWLYERLLPYYCHDNGRPEADPVVLIKMWYLFNATVSCAFCKRFPEEVSSEIFERILNKALNNRMVDPSVIFIDGTHIKASANKKKFQKQKVTETAKVYTEQLLQEVKQEREKLGKSPVKNDDDDDASKGSAEKEKAVSTTDPDCGMFVKGEHERQFAYEAHTAGDKYGMVLGVTVTAGNIHDSAAWDEVYNDVTSKFEVQFVTMDAGYKTPWIAKKLWMMEG